MKKPRLARRAAPPNRTLRRSPNRGSLWTSVPPPPISRLMHAETSKAPSPEPTVPPFDPVPLLADELSLPRAGVSATVKLLAEGATVPFIARYRKEATGGLDEVQIRAIEERRTYVLELDERRRAVVSEIHKQGKLTDALLAQDPRLRDQVRPGGPVPPLQAQAPHARHHRPGARAGAARRAHLGAAPGRQPRARGGGVRRAPRRRCPTSPRPSRARATSARSASPRTRTCASSPARPTRRRA